MGKSKYLFIIPVAGLIFLLGYVKISGVQDSPDIASSIDQLRNEGYVAFVVNEEEAEDIGDKPHPDKDKCACKGTGYIWHGDGHQTKCPYHDEPEEEEDDDDDKDHKCKCDTKRTYCNCKATYGKCSCEKH